MVMTCSHMHNYNYNYNYNACLYNNLNYKYKVQKYIGPTHYNYTDNYCAIVVSVLTVLIHEMCFQTT